MHAIHDLIKNIRIESATGAVIERIDDVNMLNSFIADSLLGKDHRKDMLFSSRVRETSHTDFEKETQFYPDSEETSTKSIEAYNTLDDLPYTPAQRNHAADSILTSGEYHESDFHNVVIPLSFLSGLFRMDTLMPPQLLDGMKIIIDWADASDVFTHNSNTGVCLLYTSPSPRDRS